MVELRDRNSINAPRKYTGEVVGEEIEDIHQDEKYMQITKPRRKPSSIPFNPNHPPAAFPSLERPIPLGHVGSGNGGCLPPPSQTPAAADPGTFLHHRYPPQQEQDHPQLPNQGHNENLRLLNGSNTNYIVSENNEDISTTLADLAPHPFEEVPQQTLYPPESKESDRNEQTDHGALRALEPRDLAGGPFSDRDSSYDKQEVLRAVDKFEVHPPRTGTNLSQLSDLPSRSTRQPQQHRRSADVQDLSLRGRNLPLNDTLEISSSDDEPEMASVAILPPPVMNESDGDISGSITFGLPPGKTLKGQGKERAAPCWQDLSPALQLTIFDHLSNETLSEWHINDALGITNTDRENIATTRSQRDDHFHLDDRVQKELMDKHTSIINYDYQSALRARQDGYESALNRLNGWKGPNFLFQEPKDVELARKFLKARGLGVEYLDEWEAATPGKSCVPMGIDDGATPTEAKRQSKATPGASNPEYLLDDISDDEDIDFAPSASISNSNKARKREPVKSGARPTPRKARSSGVKYVRKKPEDKSSAPQQRSHLSQVMLPGDTVRSSSEAEDSIQIIPKAPPPSARRASRGTEQQGPLHTEAEYVIGKPIPNKPNRSVDCTPELAANFQSIRSSKVSDDSPDKPGIPDVDREFVGHQERKQLAVAPVSRDVSRQNCEALERLRADSLKHTNRRRPSSASATPAPAVRRVTRPEPSSDTVLRNFNNLAFVADALFHNPLNPAITNDSLTDHGLSLDRSAQYGSRNYAAQPQVPQSDKPMSHEGCSENETGPSRKRSRRSDEARRIPSRYENDLVGTDIDKQAVDHLNPSIEAKDEVIIDKTIQPMSEAELEALTEKFQAKSYRGSLEPNQRVRQERLADTAFKAETSASKFLTPLGSETSESVDLIGHKSDSASSLSSIQHAQRVVSEKGAPPVKRKRGRPRKHPLPASPVTTTPPSSGLLSTASTPTVAPSPATRQAGLSLVDIATLAARHSQISAQGKANRVQAEGPLEDVPQRNERLRPELENFELAHSKTLLSTGTYSQLPFLESCPSRQLLHEQAQASRPPDQSRILSEGFDPAVDDIMVVDDYDPEQSTAPATDTAALHAVNTESHEFQQEKPKRKRKSKSTGQRNAEEGSSESKLTNPTGRGKAWRKGLKGKLG